MIRYGVTRIDHPALRDVRETCTECLVIAERAVAIAQVTGSSVANLAVDGHGASVVRLIAVLTP